MSFCQHTPILRTRKPHRCGWCGEPIPAGSPAVRGAGVTDGEFWSSYEHPECYRAAQYEWFQQAIDYPEPGTVQRGQCLEHGDTSAAILWSPEPVTHEEMTRQLPPVNPYALTWPVWRCECGLHFLDKSAPVSGDLRWNGFAWEHNHGGQHFRMSRTIEQISPCAGHPNRTPGLANKPAAPGGERQKRTGSNHQTMNRES